MASADLYALLGVARDATKAQIRAAYRKAAKMAHPDQPGGSAEKFGALKLAHDILTQDRRHYHFDVTGEPSIPRPGSVAHISVAATQRYMAESLLFQDPEFGCSAILANDLIEQVRLGL